MNPLTHHKLSRLRAPQLGILVTAIVFACAAASAQPICTPRNTAEQGRLNVAAEAEDFGLVPPCRGRLIFYIAQNTDLRRIDGRMRMTTSDDRKTSWTNFIADFGDATGGLRRAQVVFPIKDDICASITPQLKIDQCLDVKAQPMNCPSIRLVPQSSFSNLSVLNDDINICID